MVAATIPASSRSLVTATPTGRATVRLLNMNAPRRVELREEIVTEG